MDTSKPEMLSTSSSSSSDNRQAAESRPRPTKSFVLYHGKSRKHSRSCSHSPHDRSRSDKRGRCDNRKQGSREGERQASKQVSNPAFRVQRMEGFLEQIATHQDRILSSLLELSSSKVPSGDLLYNRVLGRHT